MKRKKNLLKLDHEPIRLPSQYKIEQEMQDMVKLANEDKVWGHDTMSAGKVVGLYLAWKEQKETIELMLKEQEK